LSPCYEHILIVERYKYFGTVYWQQEGHLACKNYTKVVPYQITSVGHRADPGFLAVKLT